MKKVAKKITIKDGVDLQKREMARLNRESNAKVRKLQFQVKTQEEDLQRKGGKLKN